MTKCSSYIYCICIDTPFLFNGTSVNNTLPRTGRVTKNAVVHYRATTSNQPSHCCYINDFTSFRWASIGLVSRDPSPFLHPVLLIVLSVLLLNCESSALNERVVVLKTGGRLSLASSCFLTLSTLCYPTLLSSL